VVAVHSVRLEEIVLFQVDCPTLPPAGQTGQYPRSIYFTREGFHDQIQCNMLFLNPTSPDRRARQTALDSLCLHMYGTD
jgi:hypothetical protein